MGIMSPRKQKEKLAEETGQDEGDEQKRFCADCKTTKTPLWRGGPSGPKSLCNACGIRYRKKRFACNAVSFTISSQRKRTGRHFHCLGGKGMVVNSSSVGGTNGKSSSSSNAGGSNNRRKKGWSESLRMRLMIMGSGFLLRTSFAKKQRRQRRRKFFSHEEKQAAFSLMALSCSPVFATGIMKK